MSHRFDPTTLADDLTPLIERLRPLSPEADNAAGGPYSTVFSEVTALECAFVKGGQSDTAVRKELRRLLKRQQVAPLAKIFMDLISGELAKRAMSPCSAVSILHLPGAAAKDGFCARLSPLQIYWLRMLAYCVLVAHGPAGHPLPRLPRSPAQEALPEERRFRRIALDVVPGDEPSAWFPDDVDEDDDASGVPAPALIVRR
jgi:hypothetical protein